MKQMKLWIKHFLGFATMAIIMGIAPELYAQNCYSEMLSETGTVLSAKKGQFAIRSTADQAVVKIAKTGGQAKTDVRVYVDGQLRPSNLNFANGKYTTDYRTLTLNNVQGKNIMVQVDNKSVGHIFRYALKIEGETRSLMVPAIVHQDKVSGPGRKSKSYITRATCGNKVRVIARIVDFNGTPSQHLNLRISEKDMGYPMLWRPLNQYNTELNVVNRQRIFVVESQKELKIEVSTHFHEYLGKNIEFSVNALSI